MPTKPKVENNAQKAHRLAAEKEADEAAAVQPDETEPETPDTGESDAPKVVLFYTLSASGNRGGLAFTDHCIAIIESEVPIWLSDPAWRRATDDEATAYLGTTT